MSWQGERKRQIERERACSQDGDGRAGAEPVCVVGVRCEGGRCVVSEGLVCGVGGAGICKPSCGPDP